MWHAGGVCGRYANSRRPDDLVEEFEVERTSGPGPGQDPASAGPDFNVAPTKPALVVLRRQVKDTGGEGTVDAPPDGSDAAEPAAAPPGPSAPRMLRLLTWGLVPSWAKDRSVGSRMINARADSILEKPAFRRAARRPPLPRPRRRLVRVAEEPHGEGRQGQAAQAAVLDPPRRRAADRLRGPVRVLA